MKDNDKLQTDFGYLPVPFQLETFELCRLSYASIFWCTPTVEVQLLDFELTVWQWRCFRILLMKRCI